MECVIPAEEVKTFGKVVACLAKIGEDLYFEPRADELTLRTVNSARSAYACYNFLPSFFESYSALPVDREENTQADGNFRCRILNRACQAVFRSMAMIEKSVERCTIELDPAEGTAVFKLHCYHGIVKTHRLYYEECELLQAVYSRDNSPNVLTGPSHLLSECVNNFQAGLEEISFTSSNDKLQLSNYIESGNALNKPATLQTQLLLDKTEFHRFTITAPGKITFCLKEFKTLLTFADFAGELVTIYFGKAGSPLLLTLEARSYTADFVLATLGANAGMEADEEASQAKQPPPPASQPSQQPSAHWDTQGQGMLSPVMSQHSHHGSQPSARVASSQIAATPSQQADMSQGHSSYVAASSQGRGASQLRSTGGYQASNALHANSFTPGEAATAGSAPPSLARFPTVGNSSPGVVASSPASKSQRRASPAVGSSARPMDVDEEAGDGPSQPHASTPATTAASRSQAVAASPPVYPTPGVQRHFRSIYAADDAGDDDAGEASLLCPDTEDEDEDEDEDMTGTA